MTGYLSSTIPIISKITIATVEDLGYTVDYTQADSYDGSNVNNAVSGCCAPSSSRKQLRQLASPNPKKPPNQKNKKPPNPRRPPNNPKKPLSNAGLEKAFTYGRKKLKEKMLPPGIPRDLPGGASYVGDMIISVLIMEDDEVYEVSVGA